MKQATSWLVGGIVPGLERSPAKKLSTKEEREDALFGLLLRWRDEAVKSGHAIKRIAVAFESGRDGFWLARWLRGRGIEAYVIHAASTAVSREHRRAKTDRLDIELLNRSFLGWLRGEAGHCKMVAIPTPEEEDARRPGRERETLMSECTRIVNSMKADLTRLGVRNFNPKLGGDMARLGQLKEQIRQIEAERVEQIRKSPEEKTHAMILLLAQVIGVGIETADMLVREALSRPLRDRHAKITPYRRPILPPPLFWLKQAPFLRRFNKLGSIHLLC